MVSTHSKYMLVRLFGDSASTVWMRLCMIVSVTLCHLPCERLSSSVGNPPASCSQIKKTYKWIKLNRLLNDLYQWKTEGQYLFYMNILFTDKFTSIENVSTYNPHSKLNSTHFFFTLGSVWYHREGICSHFMLGRKTPCPQNKTLFHEGQPTSRKLALKKEPL